MSRDGGLFRRYVLDTSFFSDIWMPEGTYVRDRHAGLWRHLEAQIDRGEVIAPHEVREELQRCVGDELDSWLGRHRTIFVPMRSEQLVVLAAIVRRYPAYTLGPRHLADPAVVSLAAATRLAVLTTERYQTSPSPKAPAIPNLCEEHDVQCLGVNDYLRVEGVVLG